MRNVQIKRYSSLPLLAWLVEIKRNSKDIIIICGDYVEVRSNFLVAGVWSGSFERAGFDSADVFFGTGVKWTENEISFVTPSHALERLVSYDDDKHIVFSNSIPFLMEYANLDLDNHVNQYERIFCSMLRGPEGIQRRISLKNGQFLQQYIVSSIHILSDGALEVRRRNKVEPFVSYDEYYTRMMRDMEFVYKNATSPLRLRHRYGLVSTISSGYDSSANAAIAAKLGCKTVVSLSGGIYDEDDGTGIAKQLGYASIIKKDRYSYKSKRGFIDAEYISSGELGKHQQFSVFESEFRGNLVFMGTRGDYYWGKDTVANDDFDMIGFYYYETDVSYTENALKNGYIVVAMATYGSSASTSIRKIMLSPDMKPWTLDTAYDRPIPRRILEESGVSRESFGQKKYGGGFSFCNDTLKTLSQKMSKEGFDSFKAYYLQTKHSRQSMGRFLNRIRYTFLCSPLYINQITKKMGLKPLFKSKPVKMSNPGIQLDLFFWGIVNSKMRYHESLQQAVITPSGEIIN